MVKFSISHNQRQGYCGYQQGTAFDDCKNRSQRVKERTIRKQKAKWFAKKKKEHAKEEAAVVKALQQKDEVQLEAIAVSVALFALSVTE